MTEKIQGRTGIIRAALPAGPGKEPEMVRVEATRYGIFLAVHRRCVSLSGRLAEGRCQFVLTHVPTGYALKQGLSKPEAVKYAKAVVASGFDLDFKMRDFNGWPLKKRRELAMLVGRWTKDPYQDPEPKTKDPDIPPKLQTLLDDWGITYDELLRLAVVESVLPGICMNPGCDYTTNVEPDSYQGYCECCQTRSVKSGGVLAGII